MVLRTGLRLIALTAALCGGCNLVFGIHGGELEGTGGGAAATLSVSPSQTTLLARASLQLTATLGGSAASVTWKLLDANAGALSPSGLYTAPASAGTFHVEATTLSTPAQTAKATIEVVAMVPPVVIASTGELSNATGHGTQSHLAYAQGAAQWWFFDDSSAAGTLTTKVSDDFSSWKAGASLTLPHGNSRDGRDLDVAYRQLGGHDIVHVSQGFLASLAYGRYHVRAVLSRDEIAFGPVQTVDPGGSMLGGDDPPDGTSTIILPDGLVIDTTGYQYTPSLGLPGGLSGNCGKGDVDVFTSDVTDDGVSSFDKATWSPQVLWCVPGHVQARKLLQVGDFVVLLYVDGGSLMPNTGENTNVQMDFRQSSTGFWFPPEGGTKKTPPSVFATDFVFDLDDWAAVVLGGAVHAVRRGPSTFEHRVMTTPSTSSTAWRDGAPIPAQQTLGASGLFLAPYGPGLVLVAISSDGGSVLYTAFDGTAWSPSWETLSFTTGGANFLGGFAPESGPRPAVIWTQAAGESYAVAGFQLP